jgi:hypothetical protein
LHRTSLAATNAYATTAPVFLFAYPTLALVTRLVQASVLMDKALMLRSQNVLTCIFDGETQLFCNLRDANAGEELDTILTKYSATLFDQENLTEPLRIKAAEVALKLAPLAASNKMLQEAFHNFLSQARLKERSYSVQQVLTQIAEACP